ncbi:hypothetical protein [Marinifilum breve]|uniref:hypothetical protein n=1 Tax=Marinifilum breve TaxID=2184082 RepID=UPI0014024F69|nr:hypothetical protein [Marinifilum breve]
MLEHQKMVLNAVADDPLLFKKEFEKSAQWLSIKEQKELSKWVQLNFSAKDYGLL